MEKNKTKTDKCPRCGRQKPIGTPVCFRDALYAWAKLQKFVNKKLNSEEIKDFVWKRFRPVFLAGIVLSAIIIVGMWLDFQGLILAEVFIILFFLGFFYFITLKHWEEKVILKAKLATKGDFERNCPQGANVLQSLGIF